MTASALRSGPRRARSGMSLPLMAVVGIAIAMVANLGLYALGRATDAAMMIDPAGAPPNHLIVPLDVAWKTVVPLAVGTLVLVLIGAVSRRWMTVALVIAVLGTLATAPVVVVRAHDLTTGLLLGSMHTICALVYLMIGIRARTAARVTPR